MGGDHRLVNREVQTLPIGTRVRLTSGRTGTLKRINFTRATIALDGGGEYDIAPAGEVDLAEEDAAGHGLLTDGLENAASPRAGACPSPVTSVPSPIPSTAKCDAPECASTTTSAITNRHPHAVRCAE